MKFLKKIWGEFKAFISRGNVIDLAVAVVVGAAFTAIVTSLTNDIIMPLINSAVGAGDLSSLCTVLKAVYTQDADGNRILDTANSLIINWGKFIQAVLNFIIIAVIIFALVKIINSVRNAGNKLNDMAKRDIEIKKLTKKYVKQGISADEAKQRAEREVEEKYKPKPATPPKPTTEQLLTEIRDLLAASSAADVAEARAVELANKTENKQDSCDKT